jgi:hypothetical protein
LADESEWFDYRIETSFLVFIGGTPRPSEVALLAAEI